MQHQSGFTTTMQTSGGNPPIEMLQTAIAFHQRGDLPTALKLYSMVLQTDPENFDALHLSGVISYQLGDLDNAIFCLSKAISVNYASASLHLNYGAALHQAKRYGEALESYNTAIAISLDNSDAFYNRANLFYEMKRFDEALESYDQAIAINEKHADSFYNRANTLREIMRYEEALKNYDQAISLKADSCVYINNRGVVLQEMHRYDEALQSYTQAIFTKPDYTEAYINRGNALKDFKRFEGAWQAYEKAMLIEPYGAEGYWNAGLYLLLQGNYSKGLILYESRKFKQDPLGNRTYNCPKWEGGQNLSDKTILVHWEQGLGDTIQFSRYIFELTKMGATVLFAPQKPLQKLMSMLQAPVQIVNVEDQSIVFDFHSPLLSLPLAFNTDSETIPHQVPYLVAESELLSKWKKAIGQNGFKIGICWQGSTGKVDAGRSFAVSHFESLSKIPGVRLISLHRGEGEAQLENLPHGMMVETYQLDSGSDAFMDTAAVIKCCDLVISSDTAVAHLAGALGANTWILLKYVPDWRWMLDRDDSPWYPTMRLFRQNSNGDWDDVFCRIKNALLASLREGAPPTTHL